MAAHNGHLKVVRLLAEVGAAIDQANTDCTTPLWVAAHYGRVNVAKLLIEVGADKGPPATMPLVRTRTGIER